MRRPPTTQEPTNRGGRGARRRILNAASIRFPARASTSPCRMDCDNGVAAKPTLYHHFPSKTVGRGVFASPASRHRPVPGRLAAELARLQARPMAPFDLDAGKERGNVRSRCGRGCGGRPSPEPSTFLCQRKRDYVAGLARVAGSVNPKMLANQVPRSYEGVRAVCRLRR